MSQRLGAEGYSKQRSSLSYGGSVEKDMLTSAEAFENGLGSLIIMNLIDAVMTALWVSEGIVTEGNPLMESAISQGYSTFVLGKVFMVGMGTAVLYRLRSHRLARVSLVPLVLTYSFVIGNHIGILAQLLFNQLRHSLL